MMDSIQIQEVDHMNDKNKKIIIPLSLPPFLMEWINKKTTNRSKYIRQVLEKYPEIRKIRINGFKVTAVNLEKGLITDDCRSRIIQYLLFYEYMQDQQQKKIKENNQNNNLIFHRGKWWKIGRTEK